MKFLACGIDVGSTTCKYVLADASLAVLARDYGRHHMQQAARVLAILEGLERDHGLTPHRDRIFFTGSGGGPISTLVGGRLVQEVVALAAAVEHLHPTVRFVSEIGGEDMKTIFFTGEDSARSKQVFMQSACSGGTGAFIEKIARRLCVPPEQLVRMPYEEHALHRISSKCGIFAENDANILLKAGVPVDEIIASLFEAVVHQNLATLTRGNTPRPQVLLLGGPNLFFAGLQGAWRSHLHRLWEQRGVVAGEDAVVVPGDALHYGAMGCIEVGLGDDEATGLYQGTDRLRWWLEEGQQDEKRRSGGGGLWADRDELATFRSRYARPASPVTTGPASPATSGSAPTTASVQATEVAIGCDFGSTTAKAVCLAPDGRVAFACYALSRGNPIEDARALFGQVRDAVGSARIAALGVTGYSKDLMGGILGADCAVVETVAHARAGLHCFPDADCICDVGGTDVKAMMLRAGTVVDFRLNSQCASGNGAFLQGVAERFGIALDDIAEMAFSAESMPRLSMGCGVFLQSDIVSQQRRGWRAEEILAALCRLLPDNVWLYGLGLHNLRQVGRRFILQGGTHRNLAVVKAQVDFIRARVADAEVVVHPWPGEAGAMGAALVALDARSGGSATAFRGFEAIEALRYTTTTSPATVCKWCTVNCQRIFIDVRAEGAMGRPWSRLPLDLGWERVIVNHGCPRGLVEDDQEMRAVKAQMERTRLAFPNLADLVRARAFRR